jgi:hypothetical protein
MTNEHVANIAITVTAAMLATAAVAFTLSGNAPTDPSAGDLPVVSVRVASAQTLTPAATPPGASAANAVAPGSGTTPAPRAPFAAAKSSGPPAAVASGSSASAAIAGSIASPTGSKVDKSHEPDNKGSDHEVVVPKVHESDEHDQKAYDAGKSPKD